MKKQVNKSIMIILIAIFIILGNVGISEAATGTVSLRASKTEVKAGESFEVIMGATSEDGINGITTTYEYDKDILTLEKAEVLDTVKWSSLSGTNEIAIICNSTETIKTADIFKLTFKVNSNAEVGKETKIKTGQITLDTNVTTNSQVSIGAKEVSIKVGEATLEKTLEKITITKPSKTSVEYGKILDISEMRVTAIYSDGSTKDVTNLCNYYFDGSKVETLAGIKLEKGTHTIKAKYEGKEDSFTITVTGSTIPGTTPDTNSNPEEANTSIPKTGLELITIPGIIISIIISVIAYKKYRMF